MTASVEVITDEGGFRALEPEWDRLHEAACPAQLFQTFSYQWLAWAQCASGRGYALRLIVVRESGRATVILPLVLTPARAGVVLLLTVLMCSASGVLTVRKLRSADPADLF